MNQSPPVLRYLSPYSTGHPCSRADLAWMAESQRLSAGVADINYVLPI